MISGNMFKLPLALRHHTVIFATSIIIHKVTEPLFLVGTAGAPPLRAEEMLDEQVLCCFPAFYRSQKVHMTEFTAYVAEL